MDQRERRLTSVPNDWRQDRRLVIPVCSASVNGLSHDTEIFTPDPVDHRHHERVLRLRVADEWLVCGGRLHIGRGRAETAHLARSWGLVICGPPWIGGTCCIAGDPEYYNDAVSERTRRFASENPTQARELYDRVVNHDDFDAMYSFIARMKQGDAEVGNGIHQAVPQNNAVQPSGDAAAR